MSEPLELIAPGEILIEELMRPHGISQNRLSCDIDLPVARINEIVKGKRAITADTALRLGKYVGGSAEIWLDLQMEYDNRRADAMSGRRASPGSAR
jgi:addiction module HigA family antidote